MVSAILLAREGVKVALLESQKRGGKKILASGNGHCNIANEKVSAKNYYGANAGLLKAVLNNCSLEKTERFFNSLGLEFVKKSDGKIFPKSMQASSVLNLLEAEVKRLKIPLYSEVKNLKIDKNFNVCFEGGELKAKNIILATGSPAAPQLGGSFSGLEIAKSFGHNIIKPIPALVPLISSTEICKRLAGVKVKAKVRFFADGKEISSKEGDFLFTKYGVSGLSVLDLSLKASLALNSGRKCHIIVDFFYDKNKDEQLFYLKSRLNTKRNLPLSLWLGAIINSKLADYLLKELNLQNAKESDLNSKKLKALIEHFKNYKIEIEATREFKYAEIAYGGVNSKEIDLNMQSKKKKGLYFVGEITDFAGDRGGYNFYFAWASAFKLDAKRFF